jgi:uncharacterized membrane protein YeiB
MVFVHAAGYAEGRGPLAPALALPGWFAGGKASALFCVLAGVTWSLQVGRQGRRSREFLQYYARRAAGLTLIGLGFAFTAWPGQILTYFALYMALSWFLLDAPSGRIVAAMIAVLATATALQVFFGDWWELDHPDGDLEEHALAWDFGWGSLRYNFFDGIHPAFPWLIYPLAGILIGRADWRAPGAGARLLRYSLIALVPLELWRYVVEILGEAELGDLYWLLEGDWGAFSTPFFALRNLAWAGCMLGALFASKSVLQRLHWLEPIGRLALTFYLLHVYLTIVPLGLFWPDWDWPPIAGFLAGSAFCGFALLAGGWWTRRFGQGPAERLLRWISGPTPLPAPPRPPEASVA